MIRGRKIEQLRLLGFFAIFVLRQTIPLGGDPQHRLAFRRRWRAALNAKSRHDEAAGASTSALELSTLS